MAAFAVPNVPMVDASIYPAGATVGLADGSTVTASGGGALYVPLTQVPAAIRSGFAIAPGYAPTARLMQVPVGELFPQNGTITLPDGATTTTITNGKVVIPQSVATYYRNEFGWQVIA